MCTIYIEMTTCVKRFTLTLNNYTEEEANLLYNFCEDKALYAIIGREIGENGTPHLQGFINLEGRARFSAIKKICPRAHLEKAMGTDAENKIYCSKEDKEPYEIGEPQHPGKRNDLAEACQLIKSGAKLSEVAAQCPTQFVKYTRGLTELMEIAQKPRDVNDPPTTIWLYGEAGVGKTRLAFDQLPHNEIFIKDGTSWWNGYAHEQCILVDDFDGRWPFRDFLRFLDRYPYRGQIKGGYTQINSPIIVITCEFAPSHFWQGNELAQVMRRLQHVEHL